MVAYFHLWMTEKNLKQFFAERCVALLFFFIFIPIAMLFSEHWFHTILRSPFCSCLCLIICFLMKVLLLLFLSLWSSLMLKIIINLLLLHNCLLPLFQPLLLHISSSPKFSQAVYCFSFIAFFIFSFRPPLQLLLLLLPALIVAIITIVVNETCFPVSSTFSCSSPTPI